MNIESVLKKSAFGGFTKDSVLELVEMLQNENVRLSKKAKENGKEKDELAYYKNLAAEKEKEIEILNEKNASLVEVNASYALKEEESSSNKEEYEKKLNELKERTDAIEQKFLMLQAKYDKDSAEVGCEETAKQQADSIIASVKEALKNAIEKISASNDELKDSNANLAKASEKVVEDADALIRSITEISNSFGEDEAAEEESADFENDFNSKFASEIAPEINSDFEI